MIPFSWPTNIIIIDDDAGVLEILGSMIEQNHNKLHFFTSPQEALKFITDHPQFDIPDSIAEYQEYDFSIRELKIDLKKSFKLAENKDKYNLISAIICDYDMPYISGVDLFKKASELCNARKILLTGRLDPREAIDLKGSLIDDYLEKDYKENFSLKLNQKLKDQTKYYFTGLFPSLNSLIKYDPDFYFVGNPLIKEYFYQVCKENNVTECYLIDYTGIYYLINDKKEKFIFFVQNKDQLEIMIAEYKDRISDTTLIKKLRSKAYQVVKLENEKIIYPNYDELEKYLYPINKIIDEQYYISFIKIN